MLFLLVVNCMDTTLQICFHILLLLLICKFVDCKLRIVSNAHMVTINEIEIEKGEKLHLTCENADTENLTYAWYKRLNRNVGWEQFACGKTLEVVAESQYYYCEARDTSSNNTILYNTEKEPVAVKVIVGSSSNEVYISIVVVCIIIILILALVLFFIWKKRILNVAANSKILKHNDTTDSVPIDDDGYIVPVTDSTNSQSGDQLMRDLEYMEVQHPSSRNAIKDPLYENLPTARKTRR